MINIIEILFQLHVLNYAAEKGSMNHDQTVMSWCIDKYKAGNQINNNDLGGIIVTNSEILLVSCLYIAML